METIKWIRYRRFLMPKIADAQHKLVRLASFGDTPLLFSPGGLPRDLASVHRDLTRGFFSWNYSFPCRQNQPLTDETDIFPSREFIYFHRGGNHAIWLDNELCRGRSGQCLTFGNEQLTETEDFLCTRVDVFGFVSEIWVQGKGVAVIRFCKAILNSQDRWLREYHSFSCLH